MTRPSRLLLIAMTIVAAGLAGAAYSVLTRPKPVVENQNQESTAVQNGVIADRSDPATPLEQTLVPADQKLPAGNFIVALEKLGLRPAEASSAAAAAQRVFNLRSVRAGNAITLTRSGAGTLRELDYRIDADRLLKIVPQDGKSEFTADVERVPSTMEISAVSGRIDDSLFNAMQQIGESPELTMRLAQIFGYDLDFYTDPRKGDTFRVIVEKKKYANAQTSTYGKILAAEYDNGGKRYQALLFHDPSGLAGYYTADGKSIQREFLRSPLKFAAPVTSHFSAARFHPILKVYRAHLGTDYGAPIGTPVQSIGNGKVKFAGRKGGEGNMVDILHNNGYETMYLHLAKMYVRAGEHVAIGKIIGVVGSTGLSTGPHLDFRILQKGQYKNFEKLGLPPSDPVARKDWPEFAALREKWLPILKNPELMQAAIASPPLAPPAAAHPETFAPSSRTQ